MTPSQKITRRHDTFEYIRIFAAFLLCSQGFVAKINESTPLYEECAVIQTPIGVEPCCRFTQSGATLCPKS